MQPVEKMAGHINVYRSGQADCRQPLPKFKNDRSLSQTEIDAIIALESGKNRSSP